ncbi:septum site-determining protein MinC [Rhodoferax sp. 4810]|uniref:Probable septum site-determining protein MinC n=1 Tax=Thiospirillum jenense TaxID=1653858 RepID=A0A839HIU8_9GAMM|nr:septum site-determining protein MinC [Thiospirillum jenense]MBB1075420.1 septum site-determining protein MinC [Rhodoferax jenense]MBB1126798.1 septum site-determining protein MinC [Thiospirillum jenense]
MTVFVDPSVSQEVAALDIKAATFTLPVIRLLHTAIDTIAIQIEQRVEQAPEFFHHTPVVIDISELSNTDDPVDLSYIVNLLRRFHMIPIGLRGGDAFQQEAAKTLQLALLGDGAHSHSRQATPRANRAIKPVETSPSLPEVTLGLGHEFNSMIITRPVRSGQKIYVASGDLTVIAPVSSGAELMADGNIHVYGSLRGRVFAGIKGNAQARIFCQNLHAELVAIAGHYRVNENIPNDLKGKRAQIFLDRDMLRIESL